MNPITIVQIIVSILLVAVIMLQNRGTDAGVTFGAGTQTFRSKKGFEKFLFYATIGLAVLFASLSILSVVI